MNNIQISCTINESLSTHYIIYKIINNINGKYYIGQHQTDDVFDGYMGSGKIILEAENKYGLSAFTKIILFDFDNFDDMNNKEKELVQLSNCYPNDQMSYNLTVGGNGGNKFISKSKEEITKIFNKVKQSRNNWTVEQKKQNHDKCSAASKRNWENKSDQEKNDYSLMMSQIQLSVHENRLSSEQIEINKKISSSRQNFSEEKWQDIHDKTQRTLNNKTEEEKTLTRNKISASMKKFFKGKTSEEISKITNQEKRKQTIANRTDKEKMIVRKHMRDAQINRSQEEKDQSTKKRLKTRENRSDEEKQQERKKRSESFSKKSKEEQDKIRNKLSIAGKENYAKNPDRAKKHSQRMSGKNNPSFGKRWLNNGIDRIYVNSNDIQKYLDLGYKFGFKYK